MRTAAIIGLVGVTLTVGCISAARADVQDTPPGAGLQSAVAVDTGADGICNSTAAGDDIQVVRTGNAPPYEPEVRCGPNKISETTAQGDDTQLVPVGTACGRASEPVVDTGPNGIAETPAAGDDGQLIAVGTAPPNTPCILTGANGIADTTATPDDVQLIPVGTAKPNTDVILCGPNKVADTHANNAGLGDDVQVVAVGAACTNPNQVVVTSGADGKATTRAEGSDLVVKAVGPVKVAIAKGKQAVSKTVKVSVFNVEFGTASPAGRTYALSVNDGSCPTGTVSNIDADASTKAPGLQATANVPQGKSVTGSFIATFRLQNITSVAANIPFRCSISVEADVVDPALNGAPDDGMNPENNTTPVDFEVVDKNDLP